MSEKKKQRRDQIMQLTLKMKVVSVELLAEKLAVSGQTIRRDINYLCDDNLLRRRHGGAELFEQQLNTTYQQRSTTNLEGKRAVAVTAAKKIPDSATIFISIGTTPMMVAEALRDKKHLTIVTNNLNAAMALSHEVTNRIILPGGEMRLPDRDIQSEGAVSIFSNYRADFGIFGVAGIAEDGALLDFHNSEVRTREAIRLNCRASILVTDSSKFGRSAPAVGGHISHVDHVLMDCVPENTFLPILNSLHDRIEIVGVPQL